MFVDCIQKYIMVNTFGNFKYFSVLVYTMKKISKLFGGLAGFLLTANSVLADNTSGVAGYTSKLGPISSISNDILGWVFACAILSVIISLLAVWILGNIARASNKVSDALKYKDHKTGIIIESFLIVFFLLIFLTYLVPKMQGALGIN